ncbi:valine--tRNA ligase [Candidatus Fermentibacteria bacterium]|nr:MAG: valine--tRNA ligase [Candidatus Fermentibacteria bacterium]
MALGKKYKAGESEPRWQKHWADEGIYRYNPDSGKEVYSIDTPPPTVSGMIHMGHIFSYVQAEVLARYQRMTGKEVFYPFCFDDNGLPSERFTEKVKKVRAQDMTRGEFVKLCLEVAKDAEKQFRGLWSSFGFSCDWSLMYTTIDPWVQRLSQRSFLDLVQKDRVYRKESPTLWCPECRTAVAQAETEDKEFPSHFHDLEFRLVDGNGTIPIATTRPELLPACVAVFVNPEDERWKHLKGRKVLVPLYDREVEILEDAKVAMDKGSGVVMCCTFGDTTDIQWWEEYSLDLRIILNDRGHMNEKTGFLQGMYWKKARKIIVEKLKEEGYHKGGRDITHAVNVHERCGTPLEYLVNLQWFIKILDLKDELLKKGSSINWYPDHFKVRFDHWVENLKWDWCISRQRFYGVPFPVWFCSECGTPVFAAEEELPVDPLVDSPKNTCPKCSSENFIPESDVMDTWATSSLSPQINMKWGEEDQRQQVYPMSLRPQAHDIIRTWAFYTIAKSLLHGDTIPWKDVMISGHSLNPDRQKMSKSKGNVAGDPLAALEQFSADELRYWACSSKLGTDVVFSKDVLGEGRRLVTKLWNASRFAEGRLEGYDPQRAVELKPFDRWLLSRLTETVKKATAGMDQYEYSVCMREAENFFWKALCDNYLEIAKGRLYGENLQGRAAAQHTLYTALYTAIRLFAPIMVHITEELYHEVFMNLEGHASIHLAPWPKSDFMDQEALSLGNKALLVIEEARRWKSENNLSMATALESIEATAELKPFEDDLKAVTRAEKIIWKGLV